MTPNNILKLTDLYNVQCIAFAWHREAIYAALCTNAMARRGTAKKDTRKGWILIVLCNCHHLTSRGWHFVFFLKTNILIHKVRSEKATNLKISTYLSFIYSTYKKKERWRFCKILWHSQNNWTLLSLGSGRRDRLCTLCTHRESSESHPYSLSI